MTSNSNSYVDAVVIGAGFTGMRIVFALREAGFSVQGVEKAPDIGGTWYWNRYPGCRVDTESYVYCYQFSDEMIKEWNWSEKYAGQPEVLKYLNFAADKMDIRKNYIFNTTVNKAAFDEKDQLWHVELNDGHSLSARYLITAVGPLSTPQMPAYEGIETFKGESYHSGMWPADPDGGFGGAQINFAGKRVGVIGTGATGVQIITEVAKTASELYVFQRTPNWCVPLGNTPLTPTDMDKIRSGYAELLELCKSSYTAFPHKFVERSALDDTPEERKKFFEELYATPGYGIWLANYQDVLTNKEANAYISEFVADKIRGRVKNPELAEKLIPTDHGFGTKRVPMESGYYEVYNQPNTHLVDLKETPLERITEKGVKTSDEEIELDVIIYATGFDAVTGAFDKMDIRGRHGRSLKETWADGPVTYLGLQVVGFPNMFTLVAAHNGASFCNIPMCGEIQVDWVMRLLTYMREHGHHMIEPTQAAEDEWTREVYELISKTLFAGVRSWFAGVNTNIPGRDKPRPVVYAGGGPLYRKTCDDIADSRYRGFEFDVSEGSGQPDRTEPDLAVGS